MAGNDWQGDVLHQLSGAGAGQAQPAAAAAASPQQGHQAGPPETAGPGEQLQPRPEMSQFAQPRTAGEQTAAPRPAPVSVPVLNPDLARAQGKPRHGEPAAARVGRGLRKLAGSSAAAEVAAVTRVAQDLQQPITTGRQIVVTSIRGGAGKTTVAALLGRTFEHYRHDPVLLVEADPSLGTLPIRTGAETVRWTCGDLAQIIDPSMQLTDITGYLVQLPEGGWLLPGSQGTVGARLELAQYREVMVALRRYFGITVVDCETLPSELSRTALVAAQARVLVAPATPEGVTSTRAILDWMAGVPRPKLLPGTVVVLTSSAPHMTMDEEAAAAHLRLDGVEVVHLPYDRHLAAGGVIRTGMLGERTRAAATRLAAELLNRAVGGHR
ncbi:MULTISPECIES: hypothetical protein [Streptomyces]|uniref:CobQ/CobB/MinD/ParA nucleotide binding domain-containing protein n=2 Tax=Streptomyces TaxID=1883 RepID=A0A3R7EY63_9ACTN|nr:MULTISPECIES: hypothetical protein [Streptomyces]KNE84028.1 hypothetical protein ADZ36_01705 [Streptomyces fradiae]PQM24713.1 hypothetical protein Sfr7A_00400 [Streptomyces xinghaiensis]RKM98766.1 hypothetical protein SFRA_000400 [Streptomyces xinghaiensis]RNC76333.1 hypothetical protein DC095_003975 [Streptomyces xinghaiensis]